jgi:hypothetical protein
MRRRVLSLSLVHVPDDAKSPEISTVIVEEPPAPHFQEDLCAGLLQLSSRPRAGAGGHAAAQKQTIKVSTETSPVYVTVTDAEKRSCRISCQRTSRSSTT